MIRYPTLNSAINFLSNHGVKFNTVIDVGVAEISQPLIRNFPQLRHVLFEPLEEFHQKIEVNYQNLDYELHKIALSDYKGEGELFYKTYEGRRDFIWSGIVCSEINSENLPRRKISIDKLDNLISPTKHKAPYYLKIDVDGGELKVLKGASEVLKNTAVIQVEGTLNQRCFKDLNATKEQGVLNNINWFNEKGFRLWEIVDLYYVEGMLLNIELIFISEEVYKKVGSLSDNLEEVEDQFFNNTIRNLKKDK